jgi:hypothetical protein
MSFTIFKELKPADFDSKENLKIDKKDNSVYVLVNFSLFDKVILISAAYGIQKFADVVLDSNGDDYAIVKLTKTDFEGTLEQLGREFNNRLIDSANYFANLKYAKEVKEKVVGEVYSQLSEVQKTQRESSETLPPESGRDFDNQGMVSQEFKDQDKIDEELEDDLEDFDADEIVLPWEEKFKNELEGKENTTPDGDEEDTRKGK